MRKFFAGRVVAQAFDPSPMNIVIQVGSSEIRITHAELRDLEHIVNQLIRHAQNTFDGKHHYGTEVI